MRKYLATISLEEGVVKGHKVRLGTRGYLYYHAGDIWCRAGWRGIAWPTQTGCPSADDAAATIEAAWGRDWDLAWIARKE